MDACNWDLICSQPAFWTGLLYNNESNHRYWVRYSNEKLETRLGLQKVVFGPSFILRSLSWFDTIDLRDPKGQTDGVEAFRLRWYPSNKLSINSISYSYTFVFLSSITL